MDKEEEQLSNEEDENMSGAVKDQGYRKTSLSSQKLEEISVRPVTIKDGKSLPLIFLNPRKEKGLAAGQIRRHRRI